ncbi:hypothetical protein ACFX1T_009842 [Malus domestica]
MFVQSDEVDDVATWIPSKVSVLKRGKRFISIQSPGIKPESLDAWALKKEIRRWRLGLYQQETVGIGYTYLGSDITSPKQFSIHEYLGESRPVTVLLQSLPKSSIILFVKHINTLIIHPLVFKNSNNLLRETTQWGTSRTLDEGHNFVSFTNQSMSSSNGTVRCTLGPGVSRRSDFFFLGGGFQTHVALADSLPRGTFPVAFMCSSIHDFQASVRTAAH